MKMNQLLVVEEKVLPSSVVVWDMRRAGDFQ